MACCHLQLQGNVLDVVVLQEEHSIIYSIDNLHEPLTKDIVQHSRNNPAIGCFEYNSRLDVWQPSIKWQKNAQSINQFALRQVDVGEEAKGGRGPLNELFYGMENLRKRGQEE